MKLKLVRNEAPIVEMNTLELGDIAEVVDHTTPHEGRLVLCTYNEELGKYFLVPDGTGDYFSGTCTLDVRILGVGDRLEVV